MASVKEFVLVFVIAAVVYFSVVAVAEEGVGGAWIAPIYIALSVIGCSFAFPTPVFRPQDCLDPQIFRVRLPIIGCFG